MGCVEEITEQKSATEEASPTGETAKSDVPPIAESNWCGPPHAEPKTNVEQPANTTTNEPTTTGPNYQPQAELNREIRELRRLSEAYMEGDTRALDKIRIKLDEKPHLWEMLGDLTRAIERKLIDAVLVDNPLRAEAFVKRNNEIRERLSDAKASLCTQMAASRMLICWLFVQVLELKVLRDDTVLLAQRELKNAEQRYGAAVRSYTLSQRCDAVLANSEEG